MNYDYAPTKAYCEQIGLVWFGDDYAGLVDADNLAKSLGLTQEQVDALMRQHLWQTQVILTPKNYKFRMRLMIALYFLTGLKWN